LTARILSGSEVAVGLRAEVSAAVAAHDRPIGLATVLVGDDPASHTYVGAKHRAAVAAGMVSIDRRLGASSTQRDVEDVVTALNADPTVDGMLVQLPLPEGLDSDPVVELVEPGKDADGLHPFNLGRLVLGRPTVTPATPTGILRILEHYDVPVAGAMAVVVGRSFLVGRPLALMLGARGVDATVVLAHSRTPDLGAITRTADLLVVAAGKPRLIGGGDVKPGATVIDVGTNRTEAGLVGDVDFDAVVEVAGAITPVPGGVGPMTIASLLANTVALATRRRATA
jgi:methylenetetrahydrofolate dehydrogenase (NADP+) / methenyltetrahydrofolate cyclohydrolase